MRLAVAALAALLAGCSDRPSHTGAGSTPAELSPLRPQPPAPVQRRHSPLPPTTPALPARARGVHIRVRGEELHDEVDILELIGTQADGRTTLTRIRVRSGYDERARTIAISRLAALYPSGAEEITRPVAIMLWLRELAGLATDEDHEAAGMEAADQVAAEEVEDGRSDEIIARRLRLLCWIDYTDSEGANSRRQITSLHGYEDEKDGWVAERVEAYCHLRRGARTFWVERMAAVAESADALAPMDHDDIERWLRRKAGKETPQDRQRDREAADPALRERRERREARQRAADEARASAEAKRLADWAAENERRRNLAAGEEHAVIAQRVTVRTRRAGSDASVDKAEGFVIGYDTDREGRPTVIFFATRLDVKRGRALYLADARDAENHVLLELRLLPEGTPIADPTAWVAGLPRDPARTITPHG